MPNEPTAEVRVRGVRRELSGLRSDMGSVLAMLDELDRRSAGNVRSLQAMAQRPDALTSREETQRGTMLRSLREETLPRIERMPGREPEAARLRRFIGEEARPAVADRGERREALTDAGREEAQYGRTNYQMRVRGMLSRELRAEWHQNRLDTRAWERDLGSLDRQLERTDTSRQIRLRGEILDEKRARDIRNDIVNDLARAGDRENILRERAGVLGLRPVGEGMMRVGAGAGAGAGLGIRRMAGMALGAAGIGGGSTLTTIAGGFLYGGPVGAAVTAGFEAAGAVVGAERRGYGREMALTQQILPTAVATGEDSKMFLRAMVEDRKRFSMFSQEEHLDAVTAMARGTGRTETATGVLPTAVFTGQTPVAEAGRQAQIQRLTRSYDPFFGPRMMGEFAGTPLARTPAGRMLEPTFEETAGGLAGRIGGRFGAADPFGAAAQLRAAMEPGGLNLPGVRMDTVGGQDVAAGVVEGIQRSTQRGGGVMGNLNMITMLQLRKNKQVTDALATEGLSLDDVPSMMRVISRAPQLATREGAIGEAGRTIMTTMAETKRTYLTPKYYDLMLQLGGEDERVAEQLAYNKPGVDRVLTAGGRRREMTNMTPMVEEVGQREDVQRTNEYIRRQGDIELTRVLDQAGEAIAASLVKLTNDTTVIVQDAANKMVNASGDVVSMLARYLTEPQLLFTGGDPASSPATGALPAHGR